ncbi:MAG: Coenzyme F420 hydrogenase/dehydrogenase, beta subunit C-terminal domain [Candidatus Bathyarchaeia archaeon]
MSGIKSVQAAQQSPTRKPKTFGTLLSEVIRKNLCVSCGACAAACPVSVVVMKDQTPTLIGKCILCEFCYYQCPRTEPSPEELEELVFGRRRLETETFGVHLDCYTARSKREDILEVAADGGVVTALLSYAFDKGIIDCAVVSGVSDNEPWKAIPKVAVTSEELKKFAGTRYTTSQTLLGVSEAVENYGRSRIAVVGVPCQIRAIRKMQTTPMGVLKLGERVVLSVGLFCMECFSYEGLIREYLQGKKGLDLSKIRKFAIKKGKFVVKLEGKDVIEVPLEEVKPYVKPSCLQCGDFAAELADVSVGSVGSAEGWSTTILRTEAGKRLFEAAASDGYIEYQTIDQVKKGLERLTKIVALKREHSGGKQFVTVQDLKVMLGQGQT